MKSTEPAGGYGTTSRTGLAGNDWGCAEATAAPSARANVESRSSA